MPIKIQDDLPVREILEDENLFLVNEDRATHQDIRPLQICILNLMPKKEDTELQLLRMLSNTPLQLDITFLRVSSHKAVHTSYNHLHKFYYCFDEIKNRNFDGLIITGAPVEKLPYNEVDYWPELCEIMEWSKTHVHATLHICWGAQAALFYHYGIPKYALPEKLFGVFQHVVLKKSSPLFRGFDDRFYAPHSRHTEVLEEDIRKVPGLEVLAVSDEAGVFAVKTEDSRQFFFLGHLEYDRDTLKLEYLRDVGRGLPIKPPRHYFPDDDPLRTPVVRWRSAGQLIYTNWLNYYVYQTTPYDLTELEKENT